ncbi:MAG: formylmethanofuran--tetrahydromethanopterin N-formyltransferase [Nitrospinota bacterium]|nr:formylmethanofuran--tetrahydromethanopterin N-formyltransferase [Nitrospinota bacterium]
MEINGVSIDDVSAEGFRSPFARLYFTGRNGKWAREASVKAVGCATSIIGCGVEAGIEARGENFKTPDARPGDALLFFAKRREKLEKELIKRVGQVALPTPTVMVFNCLDEGDPWELGKKIALFGNGFEHEEKRHGRDCVVVPITSGEFVMEKSIRIGEGIGGANFWIYASSQKSGLKAAEKAVSAIEPLAGLVLPFAGGVVASASRVGSRYSFLKASTQEDYCPTIDVKKNPGRKLEKGIEAVFEIVLNAVSLEVARTAMKAGIEAACSGGGVVKIGAANFDGALGDIHIPLRELFS